MPRKKVLKAIAGAEDRPLVIGDIEIPCYVLEDETRVLSQRGLQSSIGMGTGGGKHGAPRIVEFLSTIQAKGMETKDYSARTFSPIEFQPPRGGRTALAYPAEILEDIIDAILDADQAGALTTRQAQLVERANILNRGLRRIGIIGLIDEATGYQTVRERRALATILEKFIAKELQPWTRTFPYEFYEEIYRLKKWPGPDGHKRPSVIGHYTNDLVYDRLAPGVLDELKHLNPTQKSGRRKSTFHQWFTPDIGHPKLKEHLAAVMALMRASPNWDRFMGNLNRAFPSQNRE